MTNTICNEQQLWVTDCGTPVCEAHIQPYVDRVFMATLTDYDAWFQCHGKPMSCQRCNGGVYESQRHGMGFDVSREGSSERGTGNVTTCCDSGETTSVNPCFIRYVTHRTSTEIA